MPRRRPSLADQSVSIRTYFRSRKEHTHSVLKSPFLRCRVVRDLLQITRIDVEREGGVVGVDVWEQLGQRHATAQHRADRAGNQLGGPVRAFVDGVERVFIVQLALEDNRVVGAALLALLPGRCNRGIDNWKWLFEVSFDPRGVGQRGSQLADGVVGVDEEKVEVNLSIRSVAVFWLVQNRRLAFVLFSRFT